MVKDLSRVVKEAKKIRDEVDDAANRLAREHVDAYVAGHVARVAEEIRNEMQGAIDANLDNVNRVFGELVNTMLYGNKQGRGEGLIELAAHIHRGELEI